MTLKFIARREEAKGVFSFFFQPPKRLHWKAGQYLAYTLDHTNPDKRGIKRHFSILPITKCKPSDYRGQKSCQ